jgi:hypothetical protein
MTDSVNLEVRVCAKMAGMRSPWITPRLNDPIRTQMYYARQGVVTQEMEYIAQREHVTGELIRSKLRAAA